MIPQHISLVNFMCYRQAAVDLTGVHVACLSGDNGAGKSALLDAITWALWGKARARRDDELIYLGQDEMEVDLVFQLGGDLYRVLRKRQAGKRGISLLDFQTQDGDRWRSLAENSLRATQAKIESVLRLDYGTFVNSAFLRQGHADEFTVKPPAERKRVLSDILGLDVWADYEGRAKDHLRQVDAEARALDLRLQEIDAELARRPEYEAELKAARVEVDQLERAVHVAQQAWQELEAARRELQHVRAQRADLSERMCQAEQEQAALAEERATRQARLDAHRQMLEQADEIEAGFAAYQAALEAERGLAEKLAALTELNERRTALDAQIADARHAAQTERELAARRVHDLEARLPAAEVLAQYDELEARVTHLHQLRESREAARVDLAQLAEERATLTAQNEALLADMNGLKERIDLLEQAGADCPLCGQPLAEPERLSMLDERRAEGKARGDAYRGNRARLAQIERDAAGLAAQIDESEPLLRELSGLEQGMARLAEQVRLGQEAAQALEAARRELEQAERVVAAEAYAPEARLALGDVLAEAAALGYDAAAYEAARRAVIDGQPFAERRAQLDVARMGLEQEQAALARVAEMAHHWAERALADGARSVELEAGAAQLETRLADGPAIERELTRVRGAEAQARQRLGAAEQRLAACNALARQMDQRRGRRAELAHLHAIYDELRVAFGVQGVPAMIIEAVVPEIEAEANRLLGRMTGGRMHVRFDTQRETLAGEVRETLDIQIMDELGERPYDNYSGGEQFRVDFALRIALSRLLARRAGAQLQTLIVDEGFGTQDAQGRERLIDAIHTIQDEFARVLVITHIEELQDAFPVRIHITKTERGSVIDVE